MAGAEFSPRDKLMCVRREIQYRRGLYPRWVAEKRMTEQTARREIALMADIARDYENGDDINTRLWQALDWMAAQDVQLVEAAKTRFALDKRK